MAKVWMLYETPLESFVAQKIKVCSKIEVDKLGQSCAKLKTNSAQSYL